MKIIFAGLKTTGKVETVWCLIELSEHHEYRWYGNFLVVWGRRGGKLQFRVREAYRRPEKMWNGHYSRYSALGKEINKKINQDYVDISSYNEFTAVSERVFNETTNLSEQLAYVYPEFEADLNKLAIWETMKL